MEQIEIQDESGDKNYFTIVPNYILNHSTATAQALYLQLKRLAGDNGFAFPASRYLREKLGISQPTLRKELKYLIEKKWIKYAGEKEIKTDGGRQKISSYKIVDLWKLNTDFYEKRGEKIARGEKIGTQGVKTRGEKIGNKEEPLEQEPSFNNNHISEQSSQGNLIGRLIYEFRRVNPSYEKFYGNKTQRAALQRMVDKYTEAKVIGFIKYLPIINADKFAKGKSITPLQLEDNLAHLVNHYNSKKVDNKPKIRNIS